MAIGVTTWATFWTGPFSEAKLRFDSKAHARLALELVDAAVVVQNVVRTVGVLTLGDRQGSVALFTVAGEPGFESTCVGQV